MGDDAFYTGSDTLEEDDELVDELEMAGLIHLLEELKAVIC